MKKIAFIFLLVIATNLFSQSWTMQTSGTVLPFASASAASYYACWMTGASNLIKRTTDGGTTWSNAFGNLSAVDAYSVFALDQNLAWIGAGDGTIYRTTNGGVNWSSVIPNPITPFIDGIYFYDPNTGFAFGDPANQQWRFYITTNGGLNWTFRTDSPNAASSTEAGWNNGFFTTDTGHIWWTTNNNRIYKGSLRGPFTFHTMTAQNATGIAFQDTNIGVAVCNNGSASLPMQRTTNGGVNWTATSFIPTGIACGISVAKYSGLGFYWISGRNNIYRSTNNGISFTSQLTLSTPGNCISMCDYLNGWCGTNLGQIYKYNYWEEGISKNKNNILRFNLFQNYPNPFNPTTNIDFSLPHASNVSLKIYDVTGNEIMDVLNEFKPAGNYSVSVDASNLTSGIYFYKLIAGNYKETKKMIVIK